MTFHSGQILAQVFSTVPDILPPSSQSVGMDLSRPMSGVDPRAAWHEVWNLEIETHHTYIAGGIRVHNTSILSFLNPTQFADIVPGSLRDQNGDGSLDYVQLDNGLGGLDASGSTIYKMETVGGRLVGVAYVTHADAYGRLVQTKYMVDQAGRIIEGTVEQTVLTGADFGYQAGAIFVPYITAAILGDDPNPFARLAVDTILGTFVQNLFEFAGGALHSQLLSGGLQDGDLDDIAAITFADLGAEIVANGIDNAQTLLSQWIMAEVFENLETDEFGGKLAALIAQEGVDYILDLTVEGIGLAIGLGPEEMAQWGLTAAEFDELFSGPNLLNLVFKAAIGTILPALESPEAQIGSSLVTLVAQFFGGVSPIVGTALGYVAGLLLDLIADDNPRAYASVSYDPATGRLEFTSLAPIEGGSEATARAMAANFADYFNAILDQADVAAHNLATVTGNLSISNGLRFGHYESRYHNGDGINYADAGTAVASRIIDVLKTLDIRDGDLNVGRAIDWVRTSTIADDSELLAAFADRLQTALDYQKYLEDSETYDALMAADPLSGFGLGWTQTLVKAHEYGYMQGHAAADGSAIVGTAGANMFRASSGRDRINGAAGDDTIYGHMGHDTLAGGEGADLLFGGADNDRLYGNEDDDTIYGGGGNDIISGGLGIDIFHLAAVYGNSTVDGGADNDLIVFAENESQYRWTTTNGVTVLKRLPDRLGPGETVTLTNVEFVQFGDKVITLDPTYNQIIGTLRDDILTGTALRDAINGLAGDDIVYGDGGDDFISGDKGADTLFGGAGNDWIFGVLGQDGVNGGADNDRLVGGADDDAVWGNSGDDTLFGDDARFGGNGDDVVDGGTGSDVLYGGDADDILEGASGFDTLYGGNGDDDLFGGTSNDSLHGEVGDDAMDGGDGHDTILGGDGDDEVNGGNGNNLLYGGGLPGTDSNGDDVLTGGTGADSIFGGGGDDRAFGGDGNDFIFAIPGSTAATPFVFAGIRGSDGASHYDEWGIDIAYGGAGNDIIGMSVNDVAFGGTGDDHFFVAAPQSRIDGGSGNDTVTITNYGLERIEWFRSASGAIAAKVMNDNNEPPYDDDFVIVVGVETIIQARGPTFRIPASGFTAMTNAAFEAAFGDPALLARLQTSIYYSAQAEPPVITGWEIFTSANNVINDSQMNGSQPLYQTAGRQMIDGAGGNDSVSTGSGDDAVRGGTGNDTLNGGGGGDALEGGDGVDSIDGGSGKDAIFAGAGNDWSDGRSGDDTMQGADGNDSMSGGAGHDLVYGQDGADTIGGWRGRDRLYGGAGDDLAFGGAAPDSIYGGDGEDTIHGEGGGDLIDGGLLNDTIYGGLGADQISGGDGIDALFGGDDRDSLTGFTGNDTLNGDGAADTLVGGDGNDALRGGVGNDSLRGDADNDTLEGGIDSDILYGGADDDLLVGGTGADSLSGGAGIDTASYSTSGAVRVDLKRGEGFGGDAQLDALSGVENVIGSNLADTITGSNGANILWGDGSGDQLSGLGSNDVLHGGNWNDILSGGDGDDTLNGDADQDSLAGEDGNDRLNGGDDNDEVDGGAGVDQLYGGAGSDTLRGGAGADALRGEAGDDRLDGGDGIDNLFGGDGADRLAGGAAADTLRGEVGGDDLDGGIGGDLLDGGDGADRLTGGGDSDQLRGGLGDDILSGDEATDSIFGEDGNDIIAGGAGDDLIVTGTGLDRIVIGANDGDDTVADFANGIDRIALLPGTYRVTVFADPAGGTRILLGAGASLILSNIAPAQVTVADFVTGPGSGVTLQFTSPITGTAGADTLVGTATADTILGMDGNDVVQSSGGTDVVYGGGGNDHLYSSGDRLFGGDGIDLFFAGSAAEHMDGGAGVDMLRYLTSSAGVTINLSRGLASGGDAAGDTYRNIEQVLGSNHADALTGNEISNRLLGWGGNDTLYGGAANDNLDGGLGADRLTGGTGDDILTGGEGSDILYGGLGADTFDGGADGDRVSYRYAAAGVLADLEYFATANTGEAAGDLYDSIENLAGTDFNDNVRGNALANDIAGSGGNDILYGRAGNDLLDGSTGTDTLFGQVGNDTLTGGTSADEFRFALGYDQDRVTDFENNVDEIVLTGLAGITTADQALANATQLGANVQFDFGGGDTLLVLNVTKGALLNDLVIG